MKHPPYNGNARAGEQRAVQESKQIDYSNTLSQAQACGGLELPSPFAREAASYVALGISVIPIGMGTKTPAISTWKPYQTRLPTPEEIAKWSAISGAGIAIVLGKLSGLVALDIDHATPEQIEAMWKIISKSPIIKIGQKGETHFYSYAGEKTTRWGKPKRYAELLSDGAYTVIPHTVHPDTGKPYYWVGESLLDYLSRTRGAAC